MKPLPVEIGLIIREAKMTHSAPAKLPLTRILNETVQVTHHDRGSLRLGKLDYRVWDFVGLHIKHSLCRSTIFTDTKVAQRRSLQDTRSIQQ
jgi:hypothetical protein